MIENVFSMTLNEFICAGEELRSKLPYRVGVAKVELNFDQTLATGGDG